MKTCVFLCLHVNFKHGSTKTCMFKFPFSAYFYPPLHHNGKWSIGYTAQCSKDRNLTLCRTGSANKASSWSTFHGRIETGNETARANNDIC